MQLEGTSRCSTRNERWRIYLIQSPPFGLLDVTLYTVGLLHAQGLAH